MTKGGATPRHGWREIGGRKVGSSGNAYHVGSCRDGFAIEVSDADAAHALRALELAHAAALAEIERVSAGGSVAFSITVRGNDATADLRDGVALTGQSAASAGVYRNPDILDVTFSFAVSPSYAPRESVYLASNAEASRVTFGRFNHRAVPSYAKLAELAILAERSKIGEIEHHAESLQRAIARERLR